MAPSWTLAALAATSLLPSVMAQSGGCGGSPTLQNGVNNVNGREYILNIPDGYDSNTQYSLIFGLHWLGGSMYDVADGNSMEAWYGLESRAQGSAIFVAPNGNNNGWANPGGEDVAFIDSIIETVEADLCVDQSSRFSTGFSFGGGMSYALACARASSFRAVAVIAGGLISGCDGGNDPIAYLGIHGIYDDVLPVQGGVGLAETFVNNNGCQAQQINLPSGGTGPVRTDLQGCSQPVSFIGTEDGHVPNPSGSLAPDATWEFFSSL